MHTPTTLTVETVLAAGRALCEPGERKVWIHDLWQVAAPLDMDLDTFKAWLVAQHLQGKLELSRWDRRATPIVEASEVSYLNGTWHRLIVR